MLLTKIERGREGVELQLQGNWGFSSASSEVGPVVSLPQHVSTTLPSLIPLLSDTHPV